MNKRELGHSGLMVAPLAFGGNVFGWTADEATSFKLLDGFVDAGFNLIDTADVYSKWIPGNEGGESERVIGNWLAQGGDRRDKVIIATKGGIELVPGEQGLSASYIRKAVDRSLQRLQTDYIDLYQSHIDDAETPLGETLGAYQDLMREGKIRAVGASNHTAERLAEALKISAEEGLPRYETLQPWYNLYDRQDFEGELEDLCLKENVSVIPYFALASGFLTGKYRSEADLADRPRAYRVKDMLNERGFRILEALDTVAERTGATPAQIALAWLMARPSIAAPIASATNMDQLNQLIGAAEITLNEEAIQLLTDASAY